MRSATWFWIVSKILGFASTTLAICHIVISGWALASSLTSRQIQIDQEIINGDAYSKHYLLTLRVCLGVSILFALLQALSALNILLSFTKRIREKVKLWAFINILSFIALLICLLLPMTINQKTGESQSLDDFWKQVSRNSEAAFDMKGNINRKNWNNLEMNVILFVTSCIVNSTFSIILTLFLIGILLSKVGFDAYHAVG